MNVEVDDSGGDAFPRVRDKRTHVPPIEARWLGRVNFADALKLQEKIVAQKRSDPHAADTVLLLEHDPVYTIGRTPDQSSLRGGSHLAHPFFRINRGGQATYHGPGQLIGYPILDLAEHRRDIRWYVEQLEETMIRATRDFGIETHRVPGKHGIWVGSANGTTAAEDKLAALGVHLSRWVTSHGFAYNVSTDLRYFDLIVPCGIKDARATSLERILGRAVEIAEAKALLSAHFADVFGYRLTPVSRGELEATVGSGRRVARESVAAAV